MDNPVITLSLPQLALAFIPVGITLVILFRWSFGTGNALYALLRMLVQLLLIGYVLAWIFGAENGILIMLVLVIMDGVFDGSRAFADSYLTLPIYLGVVLILADIAYRRFEKPCGRWLRRTLS